MECNFKIFLRVIGVIFTTIATSPPGGLPPFSGAVFAHEFAVPNFVPYLGKQSHYSV